MALVSDKHSKAPRKKKTGWSKVRAVEFSMLAAPFADVAPEKEKVSKILMVEGAAGDDSDGSDSSAASDETEADGSDDAEGDGSGDEAPGDHRPAFSRVVLGG